MLSQMEMIVIEVEAPVVWVSNNSTEAFKKGYQEEIKLGHI